MRKGRNGGGKNGGENVGKKREKMDENSGHYVIASSRPPECQPLERRTLAPQVRKGFKLILHCGSKYEHLYNVSVDIFEF